MAGRGSGGTRTTVAVSAALTTAVLPVFLVGSSSDAIREDLGVSETAIGAAVTVLFVAVGLTASPVGRLTERIGAGMALRTGLLLSGLATAAVGAFAEAWWQLALPLVVVGVSVGLIDTGGARAFADRLTPGRQGVAFGLKEASVPSASLLAGVALPTLTAEFGWRAPFLVAPLLAVLVAMVVPRRAGRTATSTTDVPTPATDAPTPATDGPTPATAPSAPPQAARTLRRFAVGVGLGAGAATAAATFLVPASTARGLSTNAAGALLVVASVASIAARVGFGRWADLERAVPIRAVAVMTGVGGLAAAVLVAPVPVVVAAGAAVLVLGAGWGWTGLAFLAAVRARPDAPAVAAGSVLTGLGVGGALGPLAFGALAGNVSYAVAWAATAAALLAASALAFSAVPVTIDQGDPVGS